MAIPERPRAEGLSSEEAGRRLAEYGPNVIAKVEEVNVLRIAAKEITEPI